MPRRTIIVLAAVLVLAAALSTAGCGGKKKPAAPSLASLGLTTKTCRQLVNLPFFFTDAMTGLGTNLDGTAAMLRRFARTAPLGIRSNFAVIARESTKIATILKGVNLANGQAATAADVAKLKQLQRRVDTNALTQSAANVSAWAQKTCGLKTGA